MGKFAYADKIIYALAALALGAGGAIYLGCRLNDLHLSVPAGLQRVLFDISGTAKCAALPAWVRYALPDGLWSLAYAMIIARLWRGKIGLLAHGWRMTIPLVGVGFEIAQAWRWVPGVFTWQDFSFSLMGASVGFLLGNGVNEKEKQT